MPFTAAARKEVRALPSAPPAGQSPSRQPAGNPYQAIYERLTARRWDSAGYEVGHVATRADVEAALDWTCNAIIDRKAEIDAGEKSGRDARIVDEMRREWMRMAERYDEATDELAALDGAATYRTAAE